MRHIPPMDEAKYRLFQAALLLVWASLVVIVYVYYTLAPRWERIWDWLSKVLVG